MKSDICRKSLIAKAAATLLCALCVTVVAVAVAFADAESSDESKKPAKKKETCFRPGAEVTFEFFFVAPPGFHLGEEPLAAVSFDKKKLGKLPVTIKPLEYSWTREELAAEEAESGHDQTSVAAEVGVKLDEECGTGELAIPAAIDVYYCNLEEGWCTSAHYDTTLKLKVCGDEKALEQGSLKVTVIVTPEI